jgi:hypothetical protein
MHGGLCGDAEPMRRPRARRTQRPCAASSRWAHAWQRPRISVAGLTLLGSGRATQMAWSWGWRCQDLEASMSVLVGVGRVSAAL